MPTSFPGVPLPTPLTRTLTMPCEVVEFLDGSEQRFPSGDPLNAFELSFVDVPAADFADVVNLVNTVKGAFDPSCSFVGPDGVTYPHLGLEQDSLNAVEGSKPGRFSFAVKMRQVAKDGTYTGAPAGAYPALPNGVYTQRPFTASARWLTTRNDLASGPRYAWAEQAATKGLWICEYPVLTAAELQTRIDFFVGQWGKWKHFSFTDPNPGGGAHAKCRFDQDGIEIRCLGAGQWATTLRVVEYF